jgi:hypothetical protein
MVRASSPRAAKSPVTSKDTWPREKLEAMDSDFVVAMERAISLGLERRPDGEAPERAA